MAIAKDNGHSFSRFQSRKQQIPLLRLHTATALQLEQYCCGLHTTYSHAYTHTHFHCMSMGFPKTAMSRPKLSPANSAYIHIDVYVNVYIWSCVSNQATVNKPKLHSIYYTPSPLQINEKGYIQYINNKYHTCYYANSWVRWVYKHSSTSINIQTHVNFFSNFHAGYVITEFSSHQLS